jgi:hypothetical protein
MKQFERFGDSSVKVAAAASFTVSHPATPPFALTACWQGY